MSLFGAIVRTAVNVVTLPVAITKDVLTCGGAAMDKDKSYTAEQIQKIKDEADAD